MSEKSSDNQRRRRSQETQQALTYQLEHVCEEFDMELILLADDHGLVLASAGDEEAVEIFGAHAKSLARGDDPDTTLSEFVADLTPEKILCESISLDDIPLYLCAVMDADPDNCKGYERARTGIQRIYYTTSELAGKKD